jgi:hypothetical protein
MLTSKGTLSFPAILQAALWVISVFSASSVTCSKTKLPGFASSVFTSSKGRVLTQSAHKANLCTTSPSCIRTPPCRNQGSTAQGRHVSLLRMSASGSVRCVRPKFCSLLSYLILFCVCASPSTASDQCAYSCISCRSFTHAAELSSGRGADPVMKEVALELHMFHVIKLKNRDIQTSCEIFLLLQIIRVLLL